MKNVTVPISVTVENPIKVSRVMAAILPTKNAKRMCEYAVISVFGRLLMLNLLDIITFRNTPFPEEGDAMQSNPIVRLSQRDDDVMAYQHVPMFDAAPSPFSCEEDGPQLGFIFFDANAGNRNPDIVFVKKEDLSSLLDEMETALILALDSGWSYSVSSIGINLTSTNASDKAQIQ